MTIVQIITVLTTILTISAASKPVGTLTRYRKGDRKSCTRDDPCLSECFDIFTITFDKPAFITALGITPGLVETTGKAGNLCYFNPTVTYKEMKQDLVSRIRIKRDGVESIDKPADKIELESKCENSVKCVFTVEMYDVAQWSQLVQQELCEPGKRVHDLSCVLCPSGTFSNQYQAAECTECPGGSNSLEGATECTNATNKCANNKEQRQTTGNSENTRLLERRDPYRDPYRDLNRVLIKNIDFEHKTF
ncbi:uncharacterized protein LOC134817175 [Bolinopsis microptera]|uniref:uncharacterized protein LOC134817175 n=1 Tax=Bolinopsis microptera TaxID=2820187 RepID=UPI00307977B3